MSPHPKLCLLSVLPPHLPLTAATSAPPWATLWATSTAFAQEPRLWLGVQLRSLAKLGKLSFAPYLPFITGGTPQRSVIHRLETSVLTSSSSKVSLSLKRKQMPKLFEMMSGGRQEEFTPLKFWVCFNWQWNAELTHLTPGSQWHQPLPNQSLHIFSRFLHKLSAV